MGRSSRCGWRSRTSSRSREPRSARSRDRRRLPRVPARRDRRHHLLRPLPAAGESRAPACRLWAHDQAESVLRLARHPRGYRAGVSSVRFWPCRLQGSSRSSSSTCSKRTAIQRLRRRDGCLRGPRRIDRDALKPTGSFDCDCRSLRSRLPRLTRCARPNHHGTVADAGAIGSGRQSSFRDPTCVRGVVRGEDLAFAGG